MQTPNIQELAQLGAEVRYREILAELATLLSAFPALKREASTPVGLSSAVRRRRPRWSAEARKAVSLRMKKYWAARRKMKK